MKSLARPRIVVLGGGFGGLEMSRYARQRLPRTDITLVSDKDYFLFKPNSIYIPFGMDPGKLMIRLAGPTKRENVRFVNARVREIDPIARRVYMEDRDKAFDLTYDFLVVATGVNIRSGEIPGMNEYASALWTPEAMLKLRAALLKLVEEARAGERRKILFLISPHNKYPGPLYEMAMVLDSWLRRKHARGQIEIAFSTYEENYIQAFGPRFHEVVTSEFRTREIEGHAGVEIEYIEPHTAAYRNGDKLAYDLLIAFPPCAAATHYGGLPTDERGFIATELATRQVIGNPDVYAVGDTADFPAKQALLAFLQADAAAEHVSARILGTQPRLKFEQVGQHGTSIMENLDKAAFTHLPMQLVGQAENPMLPLEASSDIAGLYRIGSSPLWTLARKMVGTYLPWRFKAGNPFHEDAPWKGMELGLRLIPSLPLR